MKIVSKLFQFSIFIGFLAIAIPSADAVLLPSNSDLWEYTNLNGTPATSGLCCGTDSRNMFGANLGGGPEGTAGNTLFSDGLPTGTVHTISWETLADDIIRSIGFFAVHDGFPRDATARGISRFSLFGEDLDNGNTEILLYQVFPSNPYNATPGNTSAVYNNLFLESDIATPIRANKYRAEIVQYGFFASNSSGPRVLELDAYNTFLDDSTGQTVIPEPSSIFLVVFGLGSLAFRRLSSNQ